MYIYGEIVHCSTANSNRGIDYENNKRQSAFENTNLGSAFENTIVRGAIINDFKWYCQTHGSPESEWLYIPLVVWLVVWLSVVRKLR